MASPIFSGMPSATIVTAQTSDADTLQFWIGSRAPTSASVPVGTWTDVRRRPGHRGGTPGELPQTALTSFALPGSPPHNSLADFS